MAKIVKQLIIKELKEQLAGLEGCILVDTTGLDGQNAEEFRAELRGKGMQMIVVKNSLVRRVFEDMGHGVIGDSLQGQTAVIHGEDGTLGVAKVLIPWRKKKLLPVRAGLFDGRVLGPVEVDHLASIPELPVLRSIFHSLLQGPLRRLHAAAGGPIRSFAGLIAALAKKKEKAG
ncbi:MAG: 50S ribosomal protein L10 [Planctomycetota bacterium]|nr:50S ribosomal protein L10 [Planctomycetota bacterium]